LVKKLDWTRGELAEGLRCYRAAEFFAAHEHWEAVWLKMPEPEKTFLQGLIQVAAAFHHLQRGNQKGTASLLRAALRRLDPCSPAFAGISVTPLCQEIREWLRVLEAGDTLSHRPFPQIVSLSFTHTERPTKADELG
jgi:predicted metal-dependent hydrolase